MDLSINRWMLVFASMVTFLLLRVLTALYWTPESVQCGLKNKLRWGNTLVSLFHSTITGIWALFCFWEEPRVTAAEIMTGGSISAVYLTSISLGYFIYDTVDMVRSIPQINASYGVLVHHFMVVVMFSIALNLERYLLYAELALLMEINSIFLHYRMLMKLSGVQQTSTWYIPVCLVNLGTFIVFRLGVMLILTIDTYKMMGTMHLSLYILSWIVIMALTSINTTLLYRLIKTDLMNILNTMVNCGVEMSKIKLN